jgi:hypothetical protein
MDGRRGALGVVVSVSPARAWAAAVIMWSVMRRDQPDIGDARGCGAQHDACLVVEIGVLEQAARRAPAVTHANLTSFPVSAEPGAHRVMPIIDRRSRSRHPPCGVPGQATSAARHACEIASGQVPQG